MGNLDNQTVAAPLTDDRIVEQNREETAWGTIYTQKRTDGWNYAVMLVRKYKDYGPPDGLGDLAASLEEKGYMSLIVLHPGLADYDYEMAECAFDSIPCINATGTIADCEPDTTARSLFQLNNTRTKILAPYFNLSTPEIEAEFVADCFTDMYLKVDEMIYHKLQYKTPWDARRQYMWVD